mgnify:CR=1 FL=1
MNYASRYLRIHDPLMEGPDVENVQERLTDLGYYDGAINGVYDKPTAEAVRAFQEAFGLTADGVVGPITWEAIGLGEDTSQFYDDQYEIYIDLDQKLLTLSERGRIIRSWPVGVGKEETPSPVGVWRIIQKTQDPGGPFGTRWMKLSVPWGGYGIHGTDEPDSIGGAVSHGCIRMLNEDVEELYDIVPLGTRVTIVGDVNTGRLLYLGVEPGSDVASVQQKLNRLGYYTGPINGTYTTETRDAVIAFQQDYGLTPDGVVGQETMTALQQLSDILSGTIQP